MEISLEQNFLFASNKHLFSLTWCNEHTPSYMPYAFVTFEIYANYVNVN